MIPLPIRPFMIAVAISAAGQLSAHPNDDHTPLATLDTVMVQGPQPAPGLWTAHRNGNTLLIMTTLVPLPGGISWRSPEVETRIRESEAVLAPPGIRIGLDVGMFRGAMLLPRYKRAQRNPGGQTLPQVLPPTLYARWQAASTRYHLGHSTDRLRPVYAARSLFEKAMQRHGLVNDDVVMPVVRKLARQGNIPVLETRFNLVIADPKISLDTLSRTTLDDIPCLEQTLERLDTDIDAMTTRGLLWATGDVETLRQQAFVNQKQACQDAFSSNALAKAQGITDLEGQIIRSWITAAVEALDDNRQVFAVVPFDRLDGSNGLLAALRAEGFEITEP